MGLISCQLGPSKDNLKINFRSLEVSSYCICKVAQVF